MTIKITRSEREREREREREEEEEGREVAFSPFIFFPDPVASFKSLNLH